MDTTLLKGLQVLEHLAQAESASRITDVATGLGLTKSNAYRILKTLEAAGFVRQNPASKEFSPSLKLWELGTLVASRIDLKSIAQDALRQLANVSRETVHLAVLDGWDVIYIEKIESLEPVSAYTRLGGRAPAYCVATGKALLSQMSGVELKPLFGQLRRHSTATITDPDALRAELAATRARGYAINRGEWRDSVWGIAAPVKDPSGAISAAVGISGPSFRIDRDDRCAVLAEQVLTTAEDISRSLRSHR